MQDSLLEQLKRIDDERPSFPGEHWFALGAGLWLLTRRPESALGRVATLAAGLAFVFRAASGRDGVARWLEPAPPLRRARERHRTSWRPERDLDLARAWPDYQRVRVPAISQPIDKSRWPQ
ncbi:MAG: hypothetical protein ABI156_07425 [Caldimonas sp.]